MYFELWQCMLTQNPSMRKLHWQLMGIHCTNTGTCEHDSFYQFSTSLLHTLCGTAK